MRRISRKAESFTESVIREMNRLAVEAGAVSLAQGFPDFAAPQELKDAAAAAIAADLNQYARGDRGRSARRSPRRRPASTQTGSSTPRPRSPSPAAPPKG
jgi:aminotransferase